MLILVAMCIGGYLHAQELQDLRVLQPSYSHDLLQDKEGWRVDCIQNVHSDQQGRLWLKTCGQAFVKGIEFIQYDGYRHEWPKPVNLENPSIYQLKFHDVISDNQLAGSYVRTVNKINDSKGIFLMDLTSRNVSVPMTIGLDQTLFDIRYLSDSSLLISTLSIDKEKVFIQLLKENELDTLMVFPNPNPSSNLHVLPEYKTLFQAGTLWFLYPELPLVAVNVREKSIRVYGWDDFSPADQSLLSQAPPSKSGDIHFSVLRSGDLFFRVGPHFFRRDKGTDRFIRIDTEFPNFGKALGIYQDQEKNVCWVWEDEGGQVHAVLEDSTGIRYNYSAFFKGIEAANLKTVIANNFFQEVWVSETGSLQHMYVQELHAVRHMLDGYFISSVMELQDGSFLINTVFDGWFQSDAHLNQVQAFHGPSPCSPNPFISEQSMVQQIIPDGQGSLWWVTQNVLYEYRLKSGNCQAYEIPMLLPGGQFSIALFANLGNGKFVFTNWKNYLLFFDLNQQEAFIPGGSVPEIMTGKIYDFLPGKEDILWIPTSDGLWKIDWKNQVGTRIGRESGFEAEIFQCIYQAESGKLWLGTASNGIYLYDPEANQIEKHITQDQGLAYNSVMSIFPDQQGDIWVGTENGMNLLSPKGEVITAIYDNEGLNDNLFARFDPYVSRDGRILIGNQKGLNIIDPEAIKAQLQQDQGKKKIFLTELSYYQTDARELVSTRAHAFLESKVYLPAAHRNLTVSFGMSTYVEPNRHNYAYRLAGIDSTWNYLGPQHSLTLASLPAGEYTLQIKGSDFRNNWSANMLEIPIEAEEFFYKTTWFYLLMLLPFLLFGLAWIYRVRKENLRLEATVAARTQQIREDKALIEAQAQQLLELDQAKSRFFTNISHEFRTPLTVIGGMIDQVTTQPDRWLEKGGKLIKRNAVHLLSLINQILDLRKLESGNLQLNLIQDDVVKLLRYGTESFESWASSKSLDLSFQTELKAQMMDVDPEKLLQILTNLISNAIKFTPPEGSVTVFLDKSSSAHLIVRVQDTGRGIPAEKLPLIFDRFYQVDDTTTREGEGTGIGLALTQELVRLMGGTIEVQSEAGKGTAFIVHLPITQDAPIQLVSGPQEVPVYPFPTEQTEADLDPGSDLRRPSLLIIEDNPDIVSYLFTLLEDQYELFSAADGQAGIDAALEQVPDLILTDVMMPHKNGYEVCETLKLDERTSHIPIIMLTAKADQPSRLEGYKRGADAYLAKPFDQEELMIRLKKLLEIRMTLQKRYQSGSLPAETDDPVLQIEDAFLIKARQLITDHLDDPEYRGDALGQDMGMSRTNFYRKLKALTGHSPSHFIRAVRGDHAKELLLKPDLQIAEIAYMTGFSNPAYFNRIFKQLFDLTPGEWREQQEKRS